MTEIERRRLVLALEQLSQESKVPLNAERLVEKFGLNVFGRLWALFARFSFIFVFIFISFGGCGPSLPGLGFRIQGLGFREFTNGWPSLSATMPTPRRSRPFVRLGLGFRV
jgi:hypothetical protein